MHHDDEPAGNSSPSPPKKITSAKGVGDSTRGTPSTARVVGTGTGNRARAGSEGEGQADGITAQSHKKGSKKPAMRKKVTVPPSIAKKKATGPRKRRPGRPRLPASQLKGSRDENGNYVHPSRARTKAARVAQKAARIQEREEIAHAEGELAQGQTILLSEMAEFINDYFSKAAPLNEFTPYDWWRRHKAGTLSTPLPKPVRMIGTGPLFRASDIVKWYKAYVASKGRWDQGV